MTVKVTDFKRDLFRILKEVLPDSFEGRDCEQVVKESDTPVACVSTDSGTEYFLSEYGQIQGKTSAKIDLYLSMEKTLKNNIQTDALQEKIRKAVLLDPEILKKYSKVEVTKTAALSLPGESRLRVLTHDLECTWTED